MSSGIRPLALGAMLAFFGSVNIVPSLLGTNDVDPFYVLLTVFGIVMSAFGGWRLRSVARRSEERPVSPEE